MSGQETSIAIPSVQSGVDIAGILHRKPDSASSGDQPKKIAIILHGLLAHKNQAYHKPLAAALPIDSFRFDFRGNGDSPGDWKLGDLNGDVTDLATVVSYLATVEGYTIDLIVAHSRGCMVSWIYLSQSEKVLEYVPNLVVVSGRWWMDAVLNTYSRFNKGFEQEGLYRWNITSAGQKRQYIVYPHDLTEMAKLKNPREYVRALDTRSHVLIIHGTADTVVPIQDAHEYLDALNSNKSRAPGSHRIEFVEGADHMFRGKAQPVVEKVCAWYSQQQGGHDGTFRNPDARL